MAVIDYRTALRNNEYRRSKASVGTLNAVLPFNDGSLVSADNYQIGIVPAGALVKTVTTIVREAFNAGTSITADVGITGDLDKYHDALDISSTGVTAATTGLNEVFTSETALTVTPTIVGSVPTTGCVQVVVEYILTDERDGSFAGE